MTKIKCGCQSGTKVVTQNSKSDLSLNETKKVVITIETFTVSNFLNMNPLVIERLLAESW